jgi:fructokinase
MILVIGEVVFDVFPDSKRIGGAPFNFACHLKSLGFPVAFASRVGNDENGKAVLEFLEHKGLDPQYIQKDPDHETGWVEVTCNEEGNPQFKIIPNTAFDRMEYASEIREIISGVPQMIYYGTLIQRTPQGADTLMKILETRNYGVKCFCDINLRPGCYDANSVIKSLIHCDILKLNEEELSALKILFKSRGNDLVFIDDLMHNMGIEWVCLTRGKNGSTLFTRERTWSAGVPENLKVVDAVGAGDAFAAVLAAGYLNKWEPQVILDRASMLAGAVCGLRGALPEDDGFYRDFLYSS